MNRDFVSIIGFLLISTMSMASPYWYELYENFDDGDLDYPFLYSHLVEEPPANPDESYSMVLSPSLDGSLGLLMVQGAAEDAPSVLNLHWGCNDGTMEYISFDIESPPDCQIGVCTLHVGTMDGEFETVEYSEPGSYSYEFAEGEDMSMIVWTGFDVVIDNLYYYSSCGIYPVNETQAWGDLKALYR